MQGETCFYCPDCNVEMKTVFRGGVTHRRCMECGYEIVDNYHLAVKLWTEYLETINIISSAKEISYTIVRTLDYKRQVTHDKLVALYEKMVKEFDVEEFNDICHHLAEYIDVGGDVDINANAMAGFMIRQKKRTNKTK